MDLISRSVDLFRQAAITPSQWPQCLEALSVAFRADGASLVRMPTTAASLALSQGLQHFAPDYLTTGIPDPREHRVNPRLDQGFMPDYAYFSRREIAEDAFYQEFLRPRGLGWHAAAALSPDLFVSFKRGTRFGPFEGADLTALDTVLPRLRTASRMASLTWRSEFAGQLTAFERTGCGALLLDLRARVLGMNACVQLGDGLDISNSTLDAPRSGDRLRLQKFLAAVMDGEASSTGSQTSTIALPRPSGLRPWLLDGIACTSALRSLHSEAVAMVLVTNLERPLHPATEVLHQLFGFTPAESRLARGLLSGESLKAAAARLSISEGHARQRLKSMFSKTATSRQSELILLLGRLG